MPFNVEEVMAAKADDPSALHVVLFQVGGAVASGVGGLLQVEGAVPTSGCCCKLGLGVLLQVAGTEWGSCSRRLLGLCQVGAAAPVEEMLFQVDLPSMC